MNTSWVDSEELDWNTEYYYAVKAIPSLGGDKWSNEVLAQTPVSPFPTPGGLLYERILFRICSLSWEAFPDSGYQSAYLLRSWHEDIEHSNYPRDTLMVITDYGSGQYSDSSITDRNSRYYVLATSAGEDLISYSNEICFTIGADIPWIVDENFEIGNAGIYNTFGLVSKDSHTVYYHYGEDFSGDHVVEGIDTDSGNRFGFITFDWVFCLAERPDGSILVTYRDSDQSYHMCNLSKNISSLYRQLISIEL